MNLEKSQIEAGETVHLANRRRSCEYGTEI